MFTQPCPIEIINEGIHLFIDPAAGGPSSDYAIVSITRDKGLISVRGIAIFPRGRQLPLTAVKLHRAEQLRQRSRVPAVGRGLRPPHAPVLRIIVDRTQLRATLMLHQLIVRAAVAQVPCTLLHGG